MHDHNENFYISDWFWGVIASSNKNLTLLSKILSGMSKAEIIRFQFEYRNAILNIYPSDEMRLILDGQEYFPTYDDRINFAGWAVSLGGEFVLGILNESRDLSGFFKAYYYCNPNFSKDINNCWITGDNDELEGELPELLAYNIFEDRFDDDLWEIVDELIENNDDSIIDDYRKKESYKTYPII